MAAGVGVRGVRSVSVAAVIAAIILPIVLPVTRIPGPATLFAGKIPRGVYLQVVAHPDDDLLFMSPDLLKLLARGASSVTVYLTAGESVAGMRDTHAPGGYAADRQRGIRAAYAWIAGVRDRWRRTIVTLGRMPVEVDTLADLPRVQLVFAGLPDGGDPRADGGRGALTRLWADAGGKTCVRAFLRRAACLSHGDVVEMLRALMRAFHPTTLHILDPAPPPVGHDHPDHVAAARFATEAVPAGVGVISYRGYTIEAFPPNLNSIEREVKRKVFAIYRQHDYRIGAGRRYDTWIDRMYRRRSGETLAEGSPSSS
ncbi:hypothetical protein GCM10017673_00380 [Streptosporangium violaceochromogenes]|nr:hypothetical protein GCM10017673_00380 [Streptosporangium violaceochromogenes]